MGSSKSHCSHRATDCGLSLIEAVAAIALAALLAQATARVVEMGVASLAVLHARACEDDRIFRADRLLRKQLARIRVPMAAAHLPVASNPNRIRLSYLDGNPERQLEVEIQGSDLSIRDGPRIYTIRRLGTVSMGLAEAGDSPPALWVVVEPKGGERVVIRAAFGAWPLRPADGYNAAPR